MKNESVFHTEGPVCKCQVLLIQNSDLINYYQSPVVLVNTLDPSSAANMIAPNKHAKPMKPFKIPSQAPVQGILNVIDLVLLLFGIARRNNLKYFIIRSYRC